MTYQNYKKPNLTFFVKTILITKKMSAGDQNPPSKNSFFFSSNSTHTYAKYSFKHKMAELKQGFLNSLFPFPPSFFDYQSTKTSPKSNVKNCACLENNFLTL